MTPYAYSPPPILSRIKPKTQEEVELGIMIGFSHRKHGPTIHKREKILKGRGRKLLRNERLLENRCDDLFCR